MPETVTVRSFLAVVSHHNKALWDIRSQSKWDHNNNHQHVQRTAILNY